MATPPYPPPSGLGGPFPPGDPRNNPYNDPRFAAANAEWRRDQERAWRETQRDQGRAMRDYQRAAFRQQKHAARHQARMAAEARRAQLRAMRQVHRAHSFVGPLLLIALAVAALLVYSGHMPAPVLLEWFSRWWPLLFIAAGVVRIAEWAIARAQTADRTVPVRFSLGGGTVLLLLLVCVLGLTSNVAVHANEHGFDVSSPFFDGPGRNGWQQLFGSRHEEDAPAQTHAIAPGGTLEVNNSRGDVTISGTSDDGLLHIAQHREVFAGSDSRADSLLAELNPQFSGGNDNLSLRVNGPDNSSSTLTLLAPRGVHVVLNTNRGDVAVNAFHAPVTVNANRGDVQVTAVAGDVDIHMNSRRGSVLVHSVQGAVRLAGSGDEINLNDIDGTVNVNGNFFGSGRLQHITKPVEYEAGRISFTAARIDGEVSFDDKDEFSATGAAGPILLKTRSRDITLARITGDLHVSNSSGHIDILAVPPMGTVTVDNRDGDVRVSLPSSARFTVSAETTDGSIHSDFPGIGSNVNQSTRGTLTGSVGGGGPMVHIATTHGNISFDRNLEVPLPPAPPTPPALSELPAGFGEGITAKVQADLAKSQANLQGMTRKQQQELERALSQADRAVRDAEQRKGTAQNRNSGTAGSKENEW